MSFCIRNLHRPSLQITRRTFNLPTFSRKMHIQTIPMWEGSSDNYAYLVSDDKTNEGVIIDPANPSEVLPILKDRVADGLKLTSILNTHHHDDHAGGNKETLKSFPSLQIIGGKDCAGVMQTPADKASFPLGSTSAVKITPLYTPCHTQDSICWLFEDGTDKALFSGDTLFIGGCGRFFEGTPEEMNTALNKTLAALDDDVRVYPGHEYTKQNVKFAMTIAPDNEDIKKLQQYCSTNKYTQGRSTIGDEKKHNVFMMLNNEIVQKATGEKDEVSVMSKLREMKNNS